MGVKWCVEITFRRRERIAPVEAETHTNCNGCRGIALKDKEKCQRAKFEGFFHHGLPYRSILFPL